MTVRAILGALILQFASCARLVDVQEAAESEPLRRPLAGLASVVRLEDRGVVRVARDRLVVDAPSVDAALELRGGGMLFGRRAQEVEPPAAPGGSREGRRAPLAALRKIGRRSEGARLRKLSNQQLRRIINGLKDQHVREFGCMWPDAVLFNLIKNLPEKTLRKLSQGFVRRFPGGFLYAYALNLPVWGLRTVALNLPWAVLRAIPRHVPMPAIRDMIYTMPDDLFRATINGVPDSALEHLAKHRRKRWGPRKALRGEKPPE
jgi:hypothetical protein